MAHMAAFINLKKKKSALLVLRGGALFKDIYINFNFFSSSVDDVPNSYGALFIR